MPTRVSVHQCLSLGGPEQFQARRGGGSRAWIEEEEEEITEYWCVVDVLLS